MRKLMALVAIVLVATVARSSWALFGLGDVTFDGSLEVRGNASNNETDFGNEVNGVGSGTNDHRGDTATRLRVGRNAQVTEGVMGRVELIRTPARQYGTAPTTVAGEEGLLTLHNAYVHFDDLFGFKV